ncbi:hypothetical protein BGZ72_001132 [Mortierella alpina]|nr:hypothetical protein BGZ72_001132 [Mortierella alpina]
MTALISQTPIAVRNPFALLESEHCATDRVSAEDELDLSTWCVVNSPYPSDSEQDDDQDDDDDDIIYHWRPSTDSSAVDNTNANLPEPLRLSSLSDGFTNISKAITVYSTNSALASAPEHRGAWVVKMSKARQNHSSKTSTTTTTTTTTTTDKSMPGLEASRAEKRKDISERSDEDSDDGHDKDEGSLLYMSMTEHELSKSSKASRLKNTRVATHHSRELARALGCFSEETDKIDKKAVRSRSGKSRSKNRTCKPTVLPSDY